MDRRRFEAVQALFDAALELEGDARAAFLADQCAADATLRAEVERLLALEAQHTAERGLAGAVADAARALSTDAAPAERVLGAYRLLRELGAGGMGSVWLAERADDAYRAQVAVKLLRGGFAHPELERRFRAERQILADLNHPNIARLLDGGTAPDGTPYLVMEHVDGVPITEYAAAHALDLRARLALFRQVCEAVQHAHASLVVHRDIKPSNILVDRAGVPRLLDFGIAKPLAAAEGRETTVALRLMTPSYASPEQLRAERITVATDVYALGVLLYELLAGAPPFPSAENDVEARRRILEEDAPPPSEALAARGRGKRAAFAWPVSAAQLRGDLDNIILRALEKDPARRYGTVGELSADVAAYLAGEPVRARAATARYRLGKFVRRNRGPVAAAAVVVLALSGGLGGTVWQAEEAQRARGEAVDARGEAEAAAARASEVTQFLVSLFAASDPSENGGVEPTVKDLLDEGIARVDSLEDAALKGELLMVLGNVQRWRGEFLSAAELMSRASEIWKRLDGEADTLLVTATNIGAIALQLGGFPDSAVARYEEALQQAHASIGEQHPITIAILGNLGIAKARSGQDEEAEALYRKQIELQRAVLGANHPDLTYPNSNLGLMLAIQGRYAEAEPFLREAVRIVRELHDPDSPTQAGPLENLGMMLREAGRYTEAEEFLRGGLETRRRIYGEPHRFVAGSLFSNGLLYALWARPGDHARADSMLRASLVMYDETVGPDHPGKAYTLQALGVLEMRRGSPVAAEDWFRQALALRSGTRDAPREAARSRLELAYALRAQGRTREAYEVMRQAWTQASSALRAGDPVHSRARIGMGLMMADAGEQQAAAQFQAGVAALAERIGAQHPLTVEACARGRERGLDGGAACG